MYLDFCAWLKRGRARKMKELRFRARDLDIRRQNAGITGVVLQALLVSAAMVAFSLVRYLYGVCAATCRPARVAGARRCATARVFSRCSCGGVVSPRVVRRDLGTQADHRPLDAGCGRLAMGPAVLALPLCGGAQAGARSDYEHVQEPAL